MLTEIRHILFEDTDVVRAVVDYRKKKNDPLPQGSVVKAEVKRELPVQCTLELYSDKSEVMVGCEFKHEEIRAALIMFCMNKKIPLPVKAQKDLEIIAGQVTLVISFK